MRCPLYIVTFLALFWPAAAQAMERHVIPHDGHERSFYAYFPAGMKQGESLPMVLVLHGGGGDAEGTLRMTQMAETADKYRFIAVFPEGIPARRDKFHTWNSGKCCGEAQQENIDDVGFISRLIDFMAKTYRVDTARVYATGHSNGAQMSYRLACDLSDKITAIAPNASQPVTLECEAERAVPVFHFHGTEDRCALYKGGECGGCMSDMLNQLGIAVPRKTWACDPVEEALRQKAVANGCRPETEIFYQKGDAVCRVFKNCPENAAVQYCTMYGDGHTWPGGNLAIKACETRPHGKLCRLWRSGVGEISRDIDANEMMWVFFSRYSLN